MLTKVFFQICFKSGVCAQHTGKINVIILTTRVTNEHKKYNERHKPNI